MYLHFTIGKASQDMVYGFVSPSSASIAAFFSYVRSAHTGISSFRR
jgi:hypothetical protein